MNSTSGNQIKIWKIDPTDNPERLKSYFDLLSSEEAALANKINNESFQNLYITTHAATRIILGKHLNLAATEIDIAHLDNGKPFLKKYDQIHFNLSHTHDIALFGLSTNNPIGIDVEYIKNKRRILGLAKRFLHISEYEWLTQFDHNEQLNNFYQLWCYKEACLKGVGCGLQGGLDRFSISSKQIQPGGNVQVYDNTWHFQPIDVSHKYKAAIAHKHLSFQYEITNWNQNS